jgi:hypothetical protein
MRSLSLAAVAALSGAALAGPPNDNCSNATLITDGSYSGSTTGASNDGSGTCGASGTSPDVWYRYVAALDGVLNVDTCSGTNYDSVLGLWNGCPGGGGNEISCNDDTCGLQSGIATFVTEGTEYWIRVSGFSGATGNFTIDVEATDPGEITGPDVVYSDCTGITNWGAVGGIRGYSLGSHTCNIGDTNLDWGGTTPLLAMNAYRLHEGRLMQIGQSFVKNGTGAAAGSGCGLPCNGQGGSVLGAGCLDVYGASFNGSHGILGPRSDVNAYTGTYPGASGGSGGATYKRLQIRETDLSQSGAGALYFIEGVYVAHDDASWGNAFNNASYKRVTVSGSFNLNVTGSMEIGVPALQAWQDHGNGVGQPDDSVELVTADVPKEGRFHLGSKVTDLGGGMWRYDYAVFNLNSHRSGGSFSVPMPAGASVSNLGFNDVDYHSGEPYDNTDWEMTIGTTSVEWSSPQTFFQNPDTNALRFGTMYNFWFDANVAPADGSVTLGLFRPGTPDSIDIDAVVPSTPDCPADVTGDGAIDVEDLVEVVLNWGPCDCAADVTGNGVVDVEDLVEVILNWGPC